MTQPTLQTAARALRIAAAGALALLAGCQNPPAGPAGTPPQPAGTPGAPDVVGPVPAMQGSARASAAATPRAYRQDGATHLYALNQERIYKGRLPPLLYAIGTLETHLDANGRVARLNWLRAPRHAPEVVAEIERTVRAAAPYPAPSKMGKVVYTDTWLWHKSGKFQLDTLTEGQD